MRKRHPKTRALRSEYESLVVGSTPRDAEVEYLVAIREEDLEKVEVMFTKFPPDFEFSNSTSALGIAVEAGKIKSVKVLPDKGIETLKYGHWNSALRSAARSDAVVMLKVLLDTYTEKPSSIGMSSIALGYAAEYGMEKAAKLLIDIGAEVNLRSLGGETPLDLAASGGYYLVMQLLIMSG
jgi:ankyrin repeat protein